MTELKPCVRCEQELPPSAFSDPENVFCKDCTEEIVNIVRSKYNAIEAAHFRAKLQAAFARCDGRAAAEVELEPGPFSDCVYS